MANLKMKSFLLLVVLTLYFVDTNGIRRELNPKKVDLQEFIDAMQSCGTTIGLDKEYTFRLYGSQADFNKTLCLSFCALRKLNLYVIEEEIKKELTTNKSEEHANLKEQVYKALDVCKHLFDDPCKLFDCFFDYSRDINDDEKSVSLTKFFSEGRF